MKKFFSLLLISILCFNIFNVSNLFAENNNKNILIKNKIITNNSLNKTNKGKNYVKIVDKFIEKHKSNSKKMELLKTRTEKVLNNSKIKNKILLDTVKYLNIKASIALSELEDEILTPSISEEDKKIVEEKIITLQSNLLEKSELFLNDIVKRFEELSNYEESGDLEIDFNLDTPISGKIDTNFKLNNYESITNNFDSKIKGDLKAIVESSNQGKEIKLKINSFIDLISKDGSIFLLLEDLEIIEKEGLEKLEDFFNDTIEVAKENKYIKITDPNSKASLELLKSLNPSKIINDGEEVLSKAMFEAYKKDGEKYYIQPTKHACDTFKKITNKFDPFNGKTCSDSQYKDLIKEINDFGSFYMTFDGDLNTIGFDGKLENDLEKNEGFIIFSDKEIKEFLYSITPDQEKYSEEGFELSFKTNESLKINLKEDDNYIKLDSELDNNNKFEFIDLDLISDNLTLNLNLNNRKITGEFEYIAKGYNENWERINKEKITGEITGKTNYSNKLEDFEITYKGIKTDSQEEYLNGKLGINGSKFNFIYNNIGENTKTNIDINGELDTDSIISDLDLDIEIKQKKGAFNYDTWKYEYEEELSDLFVSKINIDNRDIDGYTNIYYMDSSIEINHKGNYTDESFKLDNSYVVDSQYLNDYDGTVKGNLNIDIDMENNKNDLYLLFNILSGNTQIMNLKIENYGSRYQKDNEIKTPENTIDYEKVFGSGY